MTGISAKRFYILVACNRRDPPNGKHMEVLGTYYPRVKNGVQEIRLRFSRIKFWLGVGAEMSPMAMRCIATAGLIPQPPPRFGRRVENRFSQLNNALQENQKSHAAAVEEFHKRGFTKSTKGVFIS